MNVSTLISTIERMKASKVFRSYIEYIQFPYFRNLDKDTKITFDFPLTVFVGQNGSGKSSTLHALFGAPKKTTPYDFWFSTAVDPIQEVSSGGDRHSFFYVYRDSRGNNLEVLKQRIFKKNNPDYWETARPNLSYGMTRIPNGKRNQPLEKHVVYIDFRSELSAFDKYFYFKSPRKTKTINNKQDYLRKYSVFLKTIIDGENVIIKRYGENKNEIIRPFTVHELSQIALILGKKYVSGKIVKHKLFDEWGYSVIFETDGYSYSEAFAGSGEMAVVRLVTEVLSAPLYSLVLLDEPEVSLHPGAQKRLTRFLLEETRKKQLQIVISTHSPSIIEDLPPSAIKVFSQLPSGKFNVKNGITPAEAFFHLEQNSTRKILIMEDLLAKAIICGVLKNLGSATESLFQVDFYTGGASVIKHHFLNVYSNGGEHNKFIIFDGDQKKVEEHFNPSQVTALEQTNERYKAEILRQTGVDVQFYPDGGAEGPRMDQLLSLRKRYLEFYLRNVFYLPERKPEEIIWNQNLAEDLLTAMGKVDSIQAINGTVDFKEKFALMAEGMTGSKSDTDLVERTFLEKWLQNHDSNYDLVVGIINQIKKL